MSGHQNQGSVGASNIYADGDQKNVPKSERDERARYHEGQTHSHNQDDSKDERSIANKLGREEQRTKEVEQDAEEVHMSKKDSTLPAKTHGNEPSKGATIDQQLKEEDEAAAAKKGHFGSKQQ